MAGGGAVPPPPRQLEVRRFASDRVGELRSLHAAVSARVDGRFQQPRSARRRTTGHLPSKRGRASRGAAAGQAPEEGNPSARQSRRVRRRQELAGNPAEGFSFAGDGARRLRTHLWHAKRFTMARRWGFVLPICSQGSGRGSRAVLKRLKTGTIVHDASYFIPIQLDGPEDSLLSILGMVICPSPADKTPDLKHLQDKVMQGVCIENATLRRAGCPHSHVVGPVTYMWRPFSIGSSKLEAKEADLSNSETRFSQGSCSSSQRQLWIWIHPAMLDEGLDAIRIACDKQMQDSGVLVNCCSLEGKIARLEVMGCKAMQSLKSILHPVSKILDTSDMSKPTDHSVYSSTGPHVLEASVIDHAEILQPGAILSMIVHDPREVSSQGTDSPSETVTNQENKLLEGGDLEAPSEERHIFSSMQMHSGRHDLLLSDCREMWDSGCKIIPPVAEEILCMEKHHRRINFFCLDSENDQGQATQANGCFSRSCPVILLKHAKERWSIIVPLSWVKPFWLFLVSHGAHAIGLRERRWIASQLKIPCFPYDYPDSKAYSSFMTKEAAVFDKAAEYRPAAKRPPRVPVPPSWHHIMASLNKEDGTVRCLEVDDLKPSDTVLPECFSLNSNCGDSGSSPTTVVASFQLFVPRTIQTLRHYVKELDMMSLSSSSEMEIDIDEPKLASGGTVKTPSPVNGLYLVRVLIRVFKEGFFEDGAVVCAPFLSDLTAWKTRSEEDEEQCLEKWKVQLPQSHISSYFPCLGPKDDTTRKALRWPIGFVTTGFVHGSTGKDGAAVAFCDARLLAALRQEQWNEKSMLGQEICVLVRNARSAAYRRAFATVVLEQQKEDLEFL
ncbi:hypothetical protein CFC21_052519 [Triticum aestivum]|uniref:Uncharacterized protein n=3 Tax=Triticum TaxID=4564 RepID=A0A9R0SFU1_TRITD|nr:uncharacterized protein C05D11.9-like isoform X2 [Triticum dicoccoides]XP_044363872.1 ribonucleases P/MRP protein subunit POP1-like isoform X2 [Triticum aestivum]KAF7043085.1 hypothetical protein CFC21_052519 [Triticum aestivum]VAH92194.1 unnamed protein product [Triticum turgidum subsp. durum]